MNIGSLLKSRFDSSQIAIEDGESVTYKKFNEEVIKIKNKMDIHIRNCNIGILLCNSKEFLYSYFSILYSGNIIVPIYDKMSKNDIFNVINLCNINTIITNKLGIKKLINIEYKGNIFDIDSYNYTQYIGFVEESKELQDVAIMLPTSGSLSKMKRVMLTHNNIIYNVCAHIRTVDMRKTDRTLILLSMCFGYCNITQIISTIMLGGTIVIYRENMNIYKVVEQIEKKQITNFTCIPFILENLANYNVEKQKLKSIRFICFGGSKMQEEKIRKLVKKFDYINFYQTYGQTEAGPRITIKHINLNDIDINNMGYPIKNVKIKVVNEKGNDCLPLQSGEIIVNSKSIMKGYYNNSIDTHKVLKEGWLWTGDLGHISEKGELIFEGRKSNCIKVMGISVDLEEIEVVLREHKNVVDAYVYAERRSLIGEMIIADIVPNIHPSDKLRFDILMHCKKILSPYKIPIKMIFCQNIVKTYTGKNKRK